MLVNKKLTQLSFDPTKNICPSRCSGVTANQSANVNFALLEKCSILLLMGGPAILIRNFIAQNFKLQKFQTNITVK